MHSQKWLPCSLDYINTSIFLSIFFFVFNHLDQLFRYDFIQIYAEKKKKENLSHKGKQITWSNMFIK